MRILRVVQDYWPSTGGNERWGFQHDRWFTETAGDEVQVLVLRPEWYFNTPRFRDLMKGFTFPGPFDVPDLPKVRAYQEIFPNCGSWRKARAYYKCIRPWLNESVDVVITQLFQRHAYLSWKDWPVAFEAPWLLACTYSYHNPGCRRSALMCAACFRQGGPRWWLGDQMKLALYRRFDLILGDELIASDLRKVGMQDRVHIIRHIVTAGETTCRASEATQGEEKAMVDRFARRFRFVLMQLNRLHPAKHPSLLLDTLERLPPDHGVVFAGDGPERPALEARVNASDALRDRVLFLGAVDANCIGSIAEHVSAFALTSKVSNHNTALFETMGFGIGPVVAVDCLDFPDEFQEMELILKVPPDPEQMARDIRQLLENRQRCAAMVAAAKTYVELHHSPSQMWAYRERLLELADRYHSRRRSSAT
ncbi:MAG: hypothetical protein A3H96_00355 [Acidobacteria bacterium RIFCSPLOWO2_02_FULL_67_36]|nr:MAG: hypothetical protein A3H96_00355 [Acidobacteria bacterium RIFCSPLOWO2_02_FULL_67_36]